MKSKSVLIACLLLLAALWAGYWCFTRPVAAVTHPVSVAASLSAQRGKDAWLGDPRAMPTVPAFKRDVPLSELVDTLIAQKEPRAAYAAYQLVQSCVILAQKGDLMTYDDNVKDFVGLTADQRKAHNALCAGMTERIKTTRFEHLAIAARAGVPGAGVEFLVAGPFGDANAVAMRPGDPLVQEWQKQAAEQLAASAKTGDFSSIAVLATEYDGGKLLVQDPALQLRYAAAMSGIFDRIAQKAGQAIPNPFSEKLEHDKQGLSPEAIAAALEAGKALADNAAEEHLK